MALNNKISPSHITEEDRALIESTYPLKEYLEEHYGVQWIKSGSSWKALCSFHTEKTPSLVYTPGRGMYCHGCHVSCGDSVIDFLITIEGLTYEDAISRLLRKVEADPEKTQVALRQKERAKVKAKEEEIRKAAYREKLIKERLENQETDVTRCHQHLSKKRGIPFMGLSIAQKCGYLIYSKHTGEQRLLGDCKQPLLSCYAVGTLDCSMLQFRRMDGGEFPRKGKADTIGGTKGMILGIEYLYDHHAPGNPDPPVILIVEGITDFLTALGAAYHISPRIGRQVIPLGMISTGTDIDEETANLFTGLPVCIMADSGEAGENAARKWTCQLKGFATSVKAYRPEDIAADYGANSVEDLTDLYATKYLTGTLPSDAVESAIRETINPILK